MSPVRSHPWSVPSEADIIESLRNRTAERRGRQIACVRHTSGLLQKELFKGRWRLREFFASKLIVTLVSQGLPSSFPSRPAA